MKKTKLSVAEAAIKNQSTVLTNNKINLGLAKIVALSFVLALFSISAKAQTKRIKAYFTQPTDHSFSSGVNANYLNNVVFDTLASYINRAKYTIDISQYEYKTWTGDPIYVAINAAHTRGVKIRYIQDGSYASTNTGVAALNSSIPVAASPTTTAFGICHNKFVIIDENASDTTKAIVWTGSPDWDKAMQQGDYNNVIIFQSRQLAQAYTHEFNIMWGDTTHGGAFNATNSKFGPNKPNSGNHIFHIDGTKVELYFSPSDGVNTQIVNNINSATTDLYCGMFTFTETTDASDIVARKNAGVFAAAILDKYSSGTYTPYTTTLPNGLGTNFVGYNASSTLYHNKYLIVDPSAPCRDPKVLTGSHNWTSGADTKNDENTVIVHDDTIANVYLQAFAGDFKAISTHTLATTTNPCPTAGVNPIDNNESSFNVFPNPFKNSFTVNVKSSGDVLKVKVVNVIGQTVKEVEAIGTNEMQVDLQNQPAGLYYIQITRADKIYVQKVIKD
ncbi:MAG TPA: phospholipase D-like domain-containing protein [Bacteroidia bacterium]|jgi:phosphatidylserine/phosphatidylglycerophosphate/cardiolipin synthase-like enzyme|nr:phospholipase D-like domain-containing protein [Bacteroidia bacterium]